MSELDDFYEGIKKREAARVSAIALNAAPDPDQAANDRNLAQELKLPAAVVAQSPETFQNQLKQQRDTAALREAEGIQQWLLNSENASIASDDVEALTSLERIGKAFNQADAQGIVRSQRFASDAAASLEASSVGEFFDGARQGFDDAILTNSEGKPNLLGLIANEFRQSATDRDNVPRSLVGQEPAALDDRATAIENRGFNAVGTLAQESVEAFEKEGFAPLSHKDVNGLGSAFAFVTENLAASVPEIASSLAAGSFAPVLQVALLGGEVNDELAEKTDLTRDQRVAVAAGTGVVMSALETFGLGKVFGGLLPTQVATDAVDGVLSSKLVKNGLSEAAANTLQAGIAEGSTELLQEGLTIGVTSLAGGKYDEGEIQERLTAAFITGGAVGASLRGTGEVPAAGKELVQTLGKLSNSEKSKEQLQEIDAAVEGSKLKARSPDDFFNALEAAGLGEQDLYVPAQSVKEYFQSQNLSDDEIARFGVSLEVFEEKLSHAGDIVIPVSHYGANISGTDDASFIQNHAVFDPDDLSSEQAANLFAEPEEYFKEQFDKIDAQQAVEAETRSSDAQVYEGFYSQLRAAGRSVDVAQNEALVLQSFFRANAQRVGDDSLDLSRELGLSVQGPNREVVAGRRRDEIDFYLNTLRSNRVPKNTGRSLTQFVIDEGGVQDRGGDIEGLDPKRGVIAETAAQVTERINQPSLGGLPAKGKGLALDELGRRALDAGFFPELARESTGDNKDEAADLGQLFLDALSDDLRGNQIFEAGDEVDPLFNELESQLDELGLDINELSNDQIVAALENAGNDADPLFQTADPVDSAAFKEWFGDSKVVDADGKPLVVYHGTNASIDVFNPENANSDKGVFFSSSKSVAQTYGAKVGANYVKLEDAPEFDFNGKSTVFFDGKHRSPRDLANRIFELSEDEKNRYTIDDDVLSELSEHGWDDSFNDPMDGVIIKNVDDTAGIGFGTGEIADQYIAFSPNQIKSVNNRGTFDANDDRILYQSEAGAGLSSKALGSFHGSKDGKPVGYRVVNIDDEGRFVSQANSRTSFPKDGVDETPKFVTPDPQYAVEYYGNGEWDSSSRQALVAYEFDEDSVLSGEVNDVEPEVSIGRAKTLWSKELTNENIDEVQKEAIELIAAKQEFDVEDLDQLIAEADEAIKNSKANEPKAPEPLAVVHNLSEENLNKVVELGGLAAPSLAVIRADIGFDNFGGISLIANQNLIDPQERDVRAFNADVYTPRQPRAEFRVSEKDYERIGDAIQEASKELDDSYFGFDHFDIERDGIEAIRNAPAAILTFLRESGIPYKVKTQKREKPLPKNIAKKLSHNWFDVREDPEQMAILVDYFGKKADERIALYKNNDPDQAYDRGITPYFEDDGVTVNPHLARELLQTIEDGEKPPRVLPSNSSNLRDKVRKSPKLQKQYDVWLNKNFGKYFDDTFFVERGKSKKQEYTLSNVVKAMTRTVRNGEGFNYGVGNIRSVVAREFRSLDQIKSSRSDVISGDDIEAIKSELDADFDGIADHIADARFNDVADFIVDVAQGNGHKWSGSTFDAALNDDVVRKKINDFLAKLRVAPTEYFEVKMQRAVGLNEFAAAVVPSNASKETIETLKSNGIKIVRYGKNKSRNEALQAVGKKVFFQGKDTKRGSIQFPNGGLREGETVINLFESADLSTFLHETGHFFLEAFSYLANKDTAPADMKSDLETIEKFLGIESGQEATRDQHETWARAFEAYALEGKAPSLALASAFSRFKAWLTNIYKSIQNLDVKLTPEIRDVMDRMLATEQEIAEAKEVAGLSPLFTDKAPSGMSSRDFEAYQRLARRSVERADQRLLEKTMEKVRRERKKWYQQERESVREEVELQINSKPEHRLVEALANQQWLGSEDFDVPDLRFDRDIISEMYGDAAGGVLAEISKNRLGGNRAVYTKGGVAPHETASFFGFKDARTMVQALQNTPRRKDAIEAETDRIMTERYGDPLNDGSIEQEALEAIHADDNAAVIASEARNLAKRANEQTGVNDGNGTANNVKGTTKRKKSAASITTKAYKEKARAIVDKLPVRDVLNPNSFLRAERKAAKDAEKYFAEVAREKGTGGDALGKAAEAKERQLLNHYLYREALDAQKWIAKGRETARTYASKKVRKAVGDGAIQQIDHILERFDFRVRSQGQVERTEKLADYIERVKAEGREAQLSISPKLLDEANRQHFTRLEVGELRGVFDTIENIDHLGRFKDKLIEAKRVRDLNEVADTLSESIEARFGSVRRGDQSGNTKNFFNLNFKVDAIAEDIDGEPFGDFYENFKEGLDRGATKEQKLNSDSGAKMHDIFSVYSQKELDSFNKEKEVEGANGHLWTKHQILALALNTGSQSSLDRVLDPKVDESVRLDQSQLDALLDTLDERDWNFVQNYLNHINSLWPELSEVTTRLEGVQPKKVEAKPIVTKYGTFKGGYYPVGYDPSKSNAAKRDADGALDSFLSNGRGSTAKVSDGMTQSRVELPVGKPLLYDVIVGFKHLRDTHRLIALGEAVDNSRRVLNHPKVEEAFRNGGQSNLHSTLNLMLDDVAEGPIYNDDSLNSYARLIKNNFTISRLAGNLKTVALQVTGVGQSAAVVGKRNLVRGYSQYLKRPREISNEIIAKSPFMAERQTTMQKDIYEHANDLRVQSPLRGKVKKVKDRVSNKVSRTRDKVSRWGFWPLVTTQFYAIDVPTWIAAYEAEMKKNGGNEEQAIHRADRLVERSQGGGLMPDKTAFERGTVSATTRQADFVKIFTTLSGYMVTKMNRGYLTVRKGVREVKEADTKSEQFVAAMDAATDLLLLYTSEAILIGLVQSLLTDEEEDEDVRDFILKESALGIVAGLPIVNMAASGFNGYATGGVLGSSTQIYSRIFNQASQGEIDKSFRSAAFDGVGFATGLPTTASLRIIEQLIEGEDFDVSEAFLGRNPLEN